jgi:Response regulators consisting of a CheY-like receiver domain and a winged-helix DNA-binding domain
MKKILIIEDNIDILENTAEILEIYNYQVFTAINGKEGIEMAIKTKPDIILCDIMMPEMDGYAVLSTLQKNAELNQTPFIFLSAKTDGSDLRKGMQLGANDYILKPFNTVDLLNAIENRIRKVDGTYNIGL